MKQFLLIYLAPRLVQYVVVIFIGVTVAFFAPRFSPVDPVESMMAKVEGLGMTMDPESVARMKESLKDLYGLGGSLPEQYLAFWKRAVTLDFGPSLTSFPTPVSALVKRSLPWTLGLLATALGISWLLGSFLGGVAGYFESRKWSKFLEAGAMMMYPIPYFISAIAMQILLAYVFPIFPVGGAYPFGTLPEFSLGFVLSILQHAILPGLSLVLIGMGWWFLSMKAMISRVVAEDYVTFAQAGGVSSRKILFSYAMRNAILPQVTSLFMAIGSVFSGAIITEVVFNYPGLGLLLRKAIATGDYSVIMGVIVMSIVAIASAVLILDLIYPLIDPRIRRK